MSERWFCFVNALAEVIEDKYDPNSPPSCKYNGLSVFPTNQAKILHFFIPYKSFENGDNLLYVVVVMLYLY